MKELSVNVPLTYREILEVKSALQLLNALSTKDGKEPEGNQFRKTIIQKLDKIEEQNKGNFWKTIFPPEIEKILNKLEKERGR